MSEQQYKGIGWAIFVLTLALATYWCMYQSGPAGFLLDLTEKATGHQLTQISWLITFALVGIPGWVIKNYFEGLAWNEHVRNLPPPDAREAARRSKYVKPAADLPPVPPKPVKLDNVPKGQEEFIATCPSCGNFFSAKKTIGPIKCPSCGEVVPVA